MKPIHLYPDLPENKQVFLFGMDDVLYPKKDYDLQVYYLFSNLLEYTETKPAATELIEFFKQVYQKQGEIGIFDQAQAHFNIPEQYRKAFDYTHAQGKLPLKLLLFKEVLQLLQAIVQDGKTVGLFTQGAIDVQWNKIKQTEWNGLDKHIKIYFNEELVEKYPQDPVAFIEEALGRKREDMLYFGSGEQEAAWAKGLGLDYRDIGLFKSKQL